MFIGSNLFLKKMAGGIVSKDVIHFDIVFMNVCRVP